MWYRRISTAHAEREVERASRSSRRSTASCPSRPELGDLAIARLMCRELGIVLAAPACCVVLELHATSSVGAERASAAARRHPKRFEIDEAARTIAVRFTPEEAQTPFRFLKWVFAQLRRDDTNEEPVIDDEHTRPTCRVQDLGAIAANFRAVSDQPGVPVMPILANAYGHGMVPVARKFAAAGALVRRRVTRGRGPAPAGWITGRVLVLGGVRWASRSRGSSSTTRAHGVLARQARRDRGVRGVASVDGRRST